MAKVLLVEPHMNLKDMKHDNSYVPLSLIYIGTHLEGKHPVKLFDRNVEDRDFMEFFNEYKPDIVGLPSWSSPMLQDLIILAKQIKKESPKTIIVVGGVHATVEPQSLIDAPYVDYIVRGEGEDAFMEFCNTFDEGPDHNKLSKIQNINLNPIRPFLDINSLRTPNYDLVDMSKYNQILINLSRGCPANCTFCYNAPMWGIQRESSEDNRDNRPFVRVLKSEKIIDILKMIIEKYGRKTFQIVDDNFVFFKRRVIEVCDYLKNNYKGLSWMCETRADTINDEVMVAMKAAGCHYVQVGIETGSQRVLDFLDKKTTVEQNAEAIACIKRNGIFVDASIMLGIPTETREELRETIDFIKRTEPEHPNAKIYVQQPSALFDYCVAKGWIEKPKTLEEWSTWIGSVRGLGHNCSNVPDEELKEALYEIWNYKLYKRKMLAAMYWLKMGRVAYVLKGFKRLFYMRSHLKIPFMKMKQVVVQ